MTSRERVERTLKHLPVDRAPRDIWALPGVTVARKDEFDRLRNSFPCDIGAACIHREAKRSKGRPYFDSEYTDAFGCVWEAAEFGVIGEIKNPILADWSAADSYEFPYDLLDVAHFGNVNAGVASSDLFTLGFSLVNPFERLQFLRGTENLFCDLAYETPELFKFIERLHAFNLREVELWADTDVHGVIFMDDWGSQQSLLISPVQWREIFKPLYKDYFDILKKKGKYVFFHSDGFIRSILPDLIEIGANALNCQLFCMDIEEIGRSFAGKITFWGEIDRQNLLPFGTPEEVRAGVRRVRKALDKNQGGVIAQFEWGKNDPYANAYAVFDEWAKPLEIPGVD